MIEVWLWWLVTRVSPLRCAPVEMTKTRVSSLQCAAVEMTNLMWDERMGEARGEAGSSEWMSVEPAVNEIERTLELRFGWSSDPARRDQLLDMAQERADLLRVRSLEAYASRLTCDVREQDALGERLTVGETFFYRIPQHFAAMECLLEQMQARMRAAGEMRPLRVLSAACASGEEPYTVAMLLAERVERGESALDVEIEAVDLQLEALEKARAAVYTEWSMRALDGGLRERYFSRIGKRWRLRDKVHGAVQFRAGNLMELDPDLFAAPFDVILCRNALIYFTPASMQRAVDGLTALLQPEGYLLLGPSETLRGVSTNFHLCHTHETFYYQRKQTVVLPSVEMNAPGLAMLTVQTAVGAKAPGELAGPVDWMASIGLSLDRLRAMGEPAPRNGERLRAAVPLRGEGGAVEADAAETLYAAQMAELVRLLEEERFAAALAIVEPLVADGTEAQRGWAGTVRAALLMNLERTEEAVTACAQLLDADEMSAPAHYMQSLCHERKAEYEAAIKEAEAAVYLDSNLGMAQLHLGMLSRRTGDAGRARMWFQSAKERLLNEDTMLLLLFGGGFSREGLRAVCEGELEKLGGAV